MTSTAGRRVLIATADGASDQQDIADGVAEALRSLHGDRPRFTVLDLLERCAPRAVGLAKIAYRSGEAFFPDGSGSLEELAARRPEEPVLRDLLAGGLAAGESALAALRPDAVVALHPVAGGIAAEIGPRQGFRTAVVVPDMLPRRLWVHPDVDAYFVAGPEARDALVARGVPWAKVAVSGVPSMAGGRAREADASGTRAAARGGAGVLVALQTGDADVMAELASRGVSNVRVASGAVPGALADGTRAHQGAADLTRGDVVVCGPCGSWLWAALAAGCPIVALEPIGPEERSTVDLLATAGAALVARDAADAAERVGYLAAHEERLAQMRAAAEALGRPQAGAAVVGRLLADLG